METGSTAARAGWRLWALVPVLLLAGAVGAFVWFGGSLVELIGKNPPAADELDIRRVEFHRGEIRIHVRNPQRDSITIASVTVDDAIAPYHLDGPRTVGRLRSSTVVVPYGWVAEEPISVGVTTSTGIETVKEITAAVETPTASTRSVLGYGLVGLLVGVVPVALGLLWLPALRRADRRWTSAFMALTAGLLAFLGVEALAEAFDLQADLPPGFAGPGLVLLGVAASFLGMTFLAGVLGQRGGSAGLALALLVAIGIGVHNLGEGLAIGTSFAVGELQLGTFLVVGFMIHNITEGLGIAAPMARARPAFGRLAVLALVAGAPAIAGAWIGGFVTYDVLGVLFFAIAAGAALQVVAEVARYVAGNAPGGLRSGWSIGGFLAGLGVMTITGLLTG